MFAIDICFLRLAAVYALIGMSLGIWMGVSGDHGQFPTHAHINLVGWVSFAIYGLVYRLYPAAAQSPVAPWHFGLANLGRAGSRRRRWRASWPATRSSSR